MRSLFIAPARAPRLGIAHRGSPVNAPSCFGCAIGLPCQAAARIAKCAIAAADSGRFVFVWSRIHAIHSDARARALRAPRAQVDTRALGGYAVDVQSYNAPASRSPHPRKPAASRLSCFWARATQRPRSLCSRRPTGRVLGTRLGRPPLPASYWSISSPRALRYQLVAGSGVGVDWLMCAAASSGA